MQQDVLANHAPYLVFIVAPRPFLADLVVQFASEPTLYGRELVFEVMLEGEVVASQSWRELVYDAETNGDRHKLQQAIWRLGRGEGTEEDRRLDGTTELIARHRTD